MCEKCSCKVAVGDVEYGSAVTVTVFSYIVLKIVLIIDLLTCTYY